MGYNQYNNYNGGGYGFAQPQQIRQFQQNNQGYFTQPQRSVRKRSGAKQGYKLGDADRPFVRGWNKRRSTGFTTFMCNPYHATKRRKSKSGREWENWICEIKSGFTTQIVPCLYDVMGRKVIIQQYGIVINPAKNYCGTYAKKK